jgi:DNA-binding NtrC family response regulator
MTHQEVLMADTIRFAARGTAAPSEIAAVRDAMRRVARGTISVLILGETGVGKERMAEAIHRASPRAGAPFVCVNCAALSESLVESELFGHDRGAFTGATGSKPGLLEIADGGTVFLDEIGELPPGLQVKLLRVLEERKLLRVGAVRPRAIDVRFVSATNRDLRDEIAAGRFREDLFFRLGGATLRIPPLRERTDEIPALARELAATIVADPPAISDAAFAALAAHSWPGNIRELRNTIERAILMCDGDAIEPADLELVPARGSDPAIPARDERSRIVLALERSAGNQTQAARLLRVSRATLVRRLDEYKLPRPRLARHVQ